MSVVGMPESTLRREGAETSRLAWAFVISLALHLLTFGTFEAGKQLGWWQRLQWPAWIKSPKMLTELLKKQKAIQESQPRQQEVPLIFVDVSPAQATPEPPKNAKYYSSRNSRAANEDAQKSTDTPKIEGKHPELVKTEDVPRQEFTPLQPVPPAPKSKEPQEEIKAQTTSKPGDLTVAKPDPNPKKDDGQEKRERPRTVQEAKARLQENQLAGQKMLLEGGVSLHSRDSLDARATAYGDYDWQLVAAIQSSWYQLLEEAGYAADYRGKVMLRFRLHYDGRITDLNVVDNTAGSMPGWICERAIQKPNPYNKFPTEMRRVVGDIRNIQFTFFYD
jgi:outer membrane biosynthesis protein TonB